MRGHDDNDGCWDDASRFLPTCLYIAHDTPMHLFTTNDHLARFNVDLEMGRREGALLSDTAALNVSVRPSQIMFPDMA